jgi:RNA polymerase sigma factor (sigma-70 family)
VAATPTPNPPDAIPDPEPSVTSDVALRDRPTLDLLDRVADERYQGLAWLELQSRLFERAFPDLKRSIQRGSIFERCAKAGRAIKRRSELQRSPNPEDIAAEAVECCLQRFRTEVLPAGQWDPRRGGSLEDFFTSCCLSDLANRWNWHLRRLPDQGVALDAIDEASPPRLLRLRVDPAPDPADIVAARDLVAQTLAPLNTDDRRSFVLIAAGWSLAEIARDLGIDRNTLDVRLSRARKRMKEGERYE